MDLHFISMGLLCSSLYAILYKIGNILQCKQFLTSFCMSSNGNIFYNETQMVHYKKDLRLNLFHELYKRKEPNCPVYIPIKIKKIISWNVQELWWHSYHGHKINNIIRYIVQSDADIICLQEVFEVSSIYKIVYNKDVYAHFPHFLTGNMHNSYLLGENSGLLVLSKYPIQFKKFAQFPMAAVPDIFSSKGALCFAVGQQNFITTHLQANYLNISLKQLVFINDQSPFKSDYILLGDLNLATPGKLFDIVSNNLISTCADGQILDHIISIPSKPMEITVDKIPLTDTSDHWPVIAVIK